MKAQELTNKGFPEHIVADGIIHTWLYLAGNKDERIKKGKIFNNRFKLSGLTDHGKDLVDYVRSEQDSALKWASENLKEFLPPELKDQYLSHYISFCFASDTLLRSEYYILRYIADLFEIAPEELHQKLKRHGTFKVSDITSEDLNGIESLIDTELSREQVKWAIKKLRSKFDLSESNFIRREMSRGESESSREHESDKKIVSEKQTSSKKPVSLSLNKTQHEDLGLPASANKDSISVPLVIAAVFFLVFIIVYNSIDDINEYEDNKNHQVASDVSSKSNGRSTTSSSGFTPTFINKLVINENAVQAYSEQNSPITMLPAGSIYSVVSENHSMITFEGEGRRMRAYKKHFKDYKNIDFTPIFSKKEIVSINPVRLRTNLTFASFTGEILSKNRKVTLVQETATSVQFRIGINLYWGEKSNFEDFQNVEIDYLYRLVDLVSDARVRTEPSIFSNIEFELKKGERVFVINKVPDTIFYKILISGDRFYISETTIALN